MEKEPVDRVPYILAGMITIIAAAVLWLLFSATSSHAEGVQRVCFPGVKNALKFLEEKVGAKVLIDGVNEHGAVAHLLVNSASGHWAYVVEWPGRDMLCIIDEGDQYAPHLGTPV